MNYKSLIAVAAIVLVAGTESQAQSKTGKTRQKTSGSTTLSPAPAEKPANATDERARNVSHTREFELEKENGYYQMSGERDWGTNAQLNGFPYPVINPKQHPSKNIDTTGEQIQSGLYDGKGNKSGDGAPVRSKVNQEKAARKRPAANDQPNNLNQNSQKK